MDVGNLIPALRYAGRGLRRNPGYAAVAILTLALGAGANTAVFSVVNPLMLRSLPYPDPDRVVLVMEAKGGDENNVSAPDFVDWRDQSRTMASLAAVQSFPVNLVAGDLPTRVGRVLVTQQIFAVLGVHPQFGRAFLDQDFVPGSDHVAILSWELWQSHFGGAHDLLGNTIRLDDEAFRVVGVMPRGLTVPPLSAQVWVPMVFDPGALASRGRRNLWVFGRLRPEVTLTQARTEMRSIGDRLAQAYPRSNEGYSAAVDPVRDFALGGSRGVLWKLFAGVALVLGMACLNLATLVLTRGAARRTELAVRVALGASRTRLVADLLSESAIIGVAGGLLGILLAALSLGFVRALVPVDLLRIGAIQLDAPVLAFGLAVSVLAALTAGVVPALSLTAAPRRPGESSGLAGRLQSRGGTHRVRAALSATQFALATVLLVAAVLVGRSLARLYGVDVGVHYEGVRTFAVTFPARTFDTPRKLRQAVEGVLNDIRGRQGLTHVAAVSHLPLTGAALHSGILVEGGPAAMSVDGPDAAIKVVTSGYFDALGIRVVSGRGFDDQDQGTTELVAVVNEAAARKFWPGQNAVGKWVAYDQPDTGAPKRRRVVGVVGDVRYAGPGEPAIPEVYEPYTQTENVWGWFGRSMTFVVRDEGGRALPFQGARAAVAAVDPTLPLVRWSTLGEQLDNILSRPRFNRALLSGFGGLALLLAGLGMYGVLSFAVRLRTREFGIRLALGDTSPGLLRRVLGDGLTIALVGGSAGVVLSLSLGRVLRAFLWGVEPTDPVTYVAVVVVLTLATLAGAAVPALRAAHLDPKTALEGS